MCLLRPRGECVMPHEGAVPKSERYFVLRLV